MARTNGHITWKLQQHYRFSYGAHYCLNIKSAVADPVAWRALRDQEADLMRAARNLPFMTVRMDMSTGLISASF